MVSDSHLCVCHSSRYCVRSSKVKSCQSSDHHHHHHVSHLLSGEALHTLAALSRIVCLYSSHVAPDFSQILSPVCDDAQWCRGNPSMTETRPSHSAEFLTGSLCLVSATVRKCWKLLFCTIDTKNNSFVLSVHKLWYGSCDPLQTVSKSITAFMH